MNKLYLFITLLCMIELLLAMLYLMLYGDSIFDIIKNKNLKHYKNEQITQSDRDLLNKFLAIFSESELIRLNNIMNILQEKQADS